MTDKEKSGSFFLGYSFVVDTPEMDLTSMLSSYGWAANTQEARAWFTENKANIAERAEQAAAQDKAVLKPENGLDRLIR